MAVVTYSFSNYCGDFSDSGISPDKHPDGMTINTSKGEVSWEAKSVPFWYGQAWLQVKAADNTGAYDLQRVTIRLCVPNQHWYAAKKGRL